MQIGTAAKESGVSIDTIRFYEKRGLLVKHPRSEGGFRLFGDSDVQRLKFIRNAQELGFSLDEITELVELQSEEVGACSHVQELLQRKLATVHEKLNDLKKLEATVLNALRKCRKELKATGDEHTRSCPMLKAVERPKVERRTKL